MEDQEEAEDCELEAIFDDLFGGSDPNAIHQFCNQVIEDEFRPISPKETEGETYAPVVDASQQQEEATAAVSPTTQMVPSTQWMSSPSPTTSSYCSAPSPTASGAGYTASGLEWSSGCSSDEFSTITEGLVEGCEDAMFCTNGQEEQDYQMVDFMTEQGGFDYESNWVDGEYSVLDQEEYVHSSKHEEVVVESSSLLVEHDKNHYFSNSSSTHPLVEFDEFAVL